MNTRQAVHEYIATHWEKSVRQGTDRPGIEPLPCRYTVPCIAGNFIAFFYWDTYFTNLGLLRQGKVELARSNCEAMFYLIGKKGFVPNSTFRGDDTRSQPPYLSMMVREVFEQTHDREWLRGAVAALETEYHFWMEKRATPVGLNRHFHQAPEEYLRKFYDGACVGRVGKNPDVPDAEKLAVAGHYLGEAETGWDFNPRFDGRCADFAPVDLNSNLFLYEQNFAWFYAELGQGDQSPAWTARAKRRQELMIEHLWDDARGLFFDYDFINARRSPVASLATFHPLWAGIVTEAEAKKVAANLPLFEREFGVAVCEPLTGTNYPQWGFPNGWPPLFHVTIRALVRYGLIEDARRVAEKYCALIETHFEKSGQLWEKFDVVTGGIAGGEYEAQPMLGWTAGVFIAASEFLASTSSPVN